MTDLRVKKHVKILVEHSCRVAPGDRILIEATVAAESLAREVFIQILEKDGISQPIIALAGMMPFSQNEIYLAYAKDT